MLTSIQILIVRLILLFLRFHINHNSRSQTDMREWIDEVIGLEMRLDGIEERIK